MDPYNRLIILEPNHYIFLVSYLCMLITSDAYNCHADEGYLVLSLLIVLFISLIFILSIQHKPKCECENEIIEPNAWPLNELPSKAGLRLFFSSKNLIKKKTVRNRKEMEEILERNKNRMSGNIKKKPS